LLNTGLVGLIRDIALQPGGQILLTGYVYVPPVNFARMTVVRLTPDGALVWNPAFDVTPHHLIAGIITERGIFRPPYVESLKRAFEEALA